MSSRLCFLLLGAAMGLLVPGEIGAVFVIPLLLTLIVIYLVDNE